MKLILGTAAIFVATHSAPVLAASSVDESMEVIAGQIVERTRTDGVATIGISTFTHSDGTCSDLSNYVSEFIVDNLFNAGEEKIDIIERSQLSAIFREMEMVYDGTIAPDAAKRLGEIEGVDAVVTGSLIQFGEQVKLQARMISTEDGRLFATARSEFPNVGTVAQMMASRSRVACGFSSPSLVEGGKASPAPQVVVLNNQGAQSTGQTQQSFAPASRKFTSDVFDAEVSSIRYSKSKGETSFSVRFKNTSDAPIALSYMPKSLSVSDGLGGFMAYKDNWSGLRGCYSPTRLDLCFGKEPQYATALQPGKIAQLNFRMQGEKDMDDPRMTLGFELIVTPNRPENETFSVQSVGFYDLEVDK